MDPCQQSRRETLRRLAGLTLAQTLPPAAWADAISLNALPRSALVLGNAAYRGVPELANPVNDAKAIAARLGEMRFQVASHTDASRDAMERAIREYLDSLAKSRGVGLFYFAGHGFQMAWRNYLVPVDAALDKSEDVARNTIDLTLVLDGIRRAGNPMNVVILDACRDNPFGGEGRSGKGLSQVDAPAGTLLAYATSPGNTASDGGGANGLYTENLLREMRTPDAKIEDVFKRVRLNVRRTSNGRQIPWESTSLEDDFYFMPPASLAKASQAELDRRYAEERELWQRAEAKAAAADRRPARGELDDAIAALESYLRPYPSGNFAELAQVRLDRLLARRGEQRVVPIAPPTPFTQGTVLPDLDWRVGDWYLGRISDDFRRIDRTGRRTVSAITDLQVVFNDGAVITDPTGNPIRDYEGRNFVDHQQLPNEYVVGKRWTTRFQVTNPRGGEEIVTVNYQIKARERVTVAAGTFEAFRGEGSGFASAGGRREFVWWMAPDKVRVKLKQTIQSWDARNVPMRSEALELLAFHEARHANT